MEDQKLNKGDNMDINFLKQALKNNDVNRSIEIIEEIGENKCQEAIPLLIECLETTDNKLLRNSIAIALGDIGSTIAIKPIINALQDAKTLGARGTLLYALESFDCSPYIELLVEFLINGNFEESRQSLILIESMNSTVSPENVKRCISKLQKNIERLEDKIDFLSESVDIIEELHNRNRLK